MILKGQGNLLEADAEALTNTVNCVGMMGKGIALQFRQKFPDNFRFYERACKAGEVMPGSMLVFPTGRLVNPKYIINFPTKRHWKGKSRIEDIKTGLQALVQKVRELEISSIAVPPLGCGNGGLNWAEVRPLIEKAFAELPDLRVLLYEPQSVPAASAMPVATEKPGLTVARALLIRLMELYCSQDYLLSRLEIQKLAYFLQTAGEPLRLNYVKDKYGPYAENLNHVLQRLEGHYIRGYGDRKAASEIVLLPGAAEAARLFLEHTPEVSERLERVRRLIEGFETPYGLEILATIHWVAQENPAAGDNPGTALTEFQSWNRRKHEHFRPEHICKAWQRLSEQKWIGRQRASE